MDVVKVKLFEKFFYLMDESYNSNPLSLKSALKNFDMIKISNSKKHLVLGDMLELGKYSKKLHTEIGKKLLTKHLSKMLMLLANMLNGPSIVSIKNKKRNCYKKEISNN